jgi:hypothetical protein
MTWDSVPWFVGGGAQHSPEVARLLAYASTSGAEGIVTPGDLKVAPLAVPGSSIRVLAGAALILNKAAGGAQQTYVARNVSEDVKAISATGSGSGRSDLVIAQIKDPFLAGEPWADPSDVTVGPYIFTEVIPNVAPGTTKVPSGTTGIPLARIDIPANTATITASHIKDLRKLALPRFETSTQILNAQQNGDYDLTASDWAFWPASGNGINSSIKLPVPTWATEAYVEMQVNSYAFVNGDFIGELRILLDTVAGPSTAVDLNGGPALHASSTVWAKFDVTGFQGQNVPIALQGKRWPGYAGVLRTRPYTQYTLRAEFYERAV